MPEPLPFETVLQLAGGYYVSRCLHAVADLGVADALDDRPATASDLAAAVGAHAGALDRVLSLLSSYGVFERRGEGFAHTPASRLLRSDDRKTMRSFVRMFGLPAFWKAAGALDHSVKTGEPMGDDVFPGGVWKYFAENPEASRIFDEAMTAKAWAIIPTVLAACDFSAFATIGDIGGGRGHLLQAILEKCPQSKGVLFDLPHVVEQASGIASDRLRLVAGDLFRDQVPACDAYILMEIIHDWGDKESLAILSAVRRAAPSHAKLLLIEAPIPDRPGPCWTKTLDIVMLGMLGGLQRSTEQYRDLLAQAGFRLDRAIDVGADYFIFESASV